MKKYDKTFKNRKNALNTRKADPGDLRLSRDYFGGVVSFVAGRVGPA